MDLRLLRDFITVADELHFGRAAKVQGIAQPVLSRHIQQIETDLGVELFQRTRRSVRLTHAGSIFLSSARQILLQSELALQAARHAAEGSLGSLRISCGPVTTYAILPTVLRLLKQRMPAIDVRVFHATTAEQLSSLLSNEVDVAF